MILSYLILYMIVTSGMVTTILYLFLVTLIIYLKTDAKVLASFVLHIVYFIQKYVIWSCSIEQFSPIIEASSLMWYLF